MTAARRLGRRRGRLLAPDAYAHAGKMDEAKSALAEARRREPKERAKWLLDAVPSVLVEGLRKAGLPEE